MVAKTARERPVRVLRKRPEQPTAAEVQEHEISGHEPYFQELVSSVRRW